MIAYIIAIVLAVVRLYESVKQLATQPEVNTLIGKIWQIAQNFLFDIEQYKSK